MSSHVNMPPAKPIRGPDSSQKMAYVLNSCSELCPIYYFGVESGPIDAIREADRAGDGPEGDERRGMRLRQVVIFLAAGILLGGAWAPWRPTEFS